MLEPAETKLIGEWVIDDGKIKADKTCERIEWLITNSLKQVSADDWAALYLDPNDGRYWERTYPQSEMQGGGPPSLLNITEANARKKYQLE